MLQEVAPLLCPDAGHVGRKSSSFEVLLHIYTCRSGQICIALNLQILNLHRKNRNCCVNGCLLLLLKRYCTITGKAKAGKLKVPQNHDDSLDQQHEVYSFSHNCA